MVELGDLVVVGSAEDGLAGGDPVPVVFVYFSVEEKI